MPHICYYFFLRKPGRLTLIDCAFACNTVADGRDANILLILFFMSSTPVWTGKVPPREKLDFRLVMNNARLALKLD